MKSDLFAVLPRPLRRSLAKLGGDIALARRKRRLTGAMMAERIGISRATYVRLESGDPRVSVGAYAMALHVLGLGQSFADLADPSRDQQGLVLDEERVPRRVRTRKEPTSL
jgi:DNA-binding XRE family transcriptional regulator